MPSTGISDVVKGETVERTTFWTTEEKKIEMGGRHCWCGPWRGVCSAGAALHEVALAAVGSVACINKTFNAMASLPSIVKFKYGREWTSG